MRSQYKTSTGKDHTRRVFLKSSVAGIAGLSVPGLFTGRIVAAGISKQYAGLSSQSYLGDLRIETKIVDKNVFTEGPAADRLGNVFFTNVPAEKILKWNSKSKRLTVFRTKSNKANGLLFDPQGNLLACEGGAGRVTRTNMKTGKITILADKYKGFPFAPPNDLALDARGRLFFTSRPGTNDPKKGNPNAVYRIDLHRGFPASPGGQIVHRILQWPEVHMPNGIVTSPDDKTLYVIEAHSDKDHNRNILAFDFAEDGSLTKRRVLIDFYPGRSGDGMCIDSEGNLYVAAGLHKRRGSSETLDTKPGIHVISPEGKLLAFARSPEDTITNCTFGGKDLRTLYVTCGTLLLSIPTKIPGKRAYRPKA